MFIWAAEYEFTESVGEGAWVPNWLNWGIADSRSEAWDCIVEYESNGYAIKTWRIIKTANANMRTALALAESLNI